MSRIFSKTEQARERASQEFLRHLEREQATLRLVHEDPVRLEPQAPEPDCLAHGWSRPKAFPGAPRPPEGAAGCPECREDRLRRQRQQKAETEPVIVSAHDARNVGAVRAAAAEWELQQKRRGRVIPGSSREAEILKGMDQVRDEELAKLGDTFARRRQRQRKYWKTKL